MVFELFEHKADVGVRGIGKTLKKAFSETGNALISIMIETKTIKPTKKVYITINADSIENLLIKYLNEVISQMDLNEMVFKKIEVKKIFEKQKKFFLNAVCFGENIDFGKHLLKTEVKAATYSGLKIFEKNKKFIAECIVDV